MSICPKNKSSKGRRDRRRANWKMTAPNLGFAVSSAITIISLGPATESMLT